MFYEIDVKSFIRIPPTDLKKSIQETVLEKVRNNFETYTSQELGFIITIKNIISIGEGIIIPEDGAAYYETVFKAITYKPELQEVVLGKITDITNFGAFINIGPVEGMIHISQTMDDYISFSKAGVLQGKESKRTLKTGDRCRARIIAVSFKDLANPKIGLTMRQPYLGALSYIEEDLKKQKKSKKEKEE